MHKCMSHVTKHLVSPEYRIGRHENPHETNGLPLWQTTMQFMCLASLPKCAINAVGIVNDSQRSCMRVHTGDKRNNIHGPSACCYWKMSINTDLSRCKSTSCWYNNCKHVSCLSNRKTKQNIQNTIRDYKWRLIRWKGQWTLLSCLQITDKNLWPAVNISWKSPFIFHNTVAKCQIN